MEINREEYLKLLNDVAIKANKEHKTNKPMQLYGKGGLEMYNNAIKEVINSSQIINEVDNTVHNEIKDKSAAVLPKAPNRRTRRLLWKQDEKFRKKYKKQLAFLEKYVEENGLESLSEYLENKNKDGNKGI